MGPLSQGAAVGCDVCKTLGAYSGGEPGKSKLRRDIKFPVGDRIFFAGEATAGAFSTVHGANRSGIRAATDLYISSALD